MSSAAEGVVVLAGKFEGVDVASATDEAVEIAIRFADPGSTERGLFIREQRRRQLHQRLTHQAKLRRRKRITRRGLVE